MGDTDPKRWAELLAAVFDGGVLSGPCTEALGTADHELRKFRFVAMRNRTLSCDLVSEPVYACRVCFLRPSVVGCGSDPPDGAVEGVAMVVDQTLGGFGDLLFDAALGIYVLAMTLHAAEHGLLRRNAVETVASPAATPAPAGVAAGTGSAQVPGGGSGPVAQAPADRPGPVRAPRTPAQRCGRTGVSLTVLAAGLHLAMLLLRGIAAGRPPWGNMYEFAAAVTLAAVLAWLVVLTRRPELRRLGGFVLVPVVVLMFLGGTVLYTPTGPVTPALHSYWLAIHVTTMTVASGILLFAGVASTLYLLRTVHDRTPARLGWTARLPRAEVLDRVAYRATAVAFPVFTFATIAGSVWAEAAWGRYWGWDPKETACFIAWVVYAGYLHARSTAGWRGRRAAAVNVVGLAVMIFNLFFVNLVVTGLHSYAGLPQ